MIHVKQVGLLKNLLNEAKEALKQIVEYQRVKQLEKELSNTIKQERNIPLWSRLNKDIELYAMYTNLLPNK